MVLAAASAICGIALAQLGVRALAALAPADLPRVDDIRVDGLVLVFALVVALVASIIFGLAPALQVSRVQLVDGLRQGGKGTSIGARGAWARNAFVVAEIALAVVLVFGAGLLARSLLALAAVDMGFVPQQILVLNTTVPVRGIENAHRATDFYRDLLADVRTLPGVTAAAAVTSLPTAVRSNGGYAIEGQSELTQTGVRSPQALFTVATPGLFQNARDVGQERPRLRRRRSARCAARGDHQRVARPRIVSGRGSHRASNPMRPRQPGLHDDCRRRLGCAHRGPDAAGTTRALHAIRAASRAGYGAEHRGPNAGSRSASTRRDDHAQNPRAERRRAGQGDDDGSERSTRRRQHRDSARCCS